MSSNLKQKLEEAKEIVEKSGVAAIKLEKDDVGYWRLRLQKGRNDRIYYILEYVVINDEPVVVFSTNLGRNPKHMINTLYNVLDQLDMEVVKKVRDQLLDVFASDSRRSREIKEL